MPLLTDCYSKVSLLLLLLLVLIVHGEDDHQFPEDGDEIKEQVHTVPDVVLVSVLCFLNDELSVKQHEAAHDEQSEVHVCLKQHHRSKEHVHHRHQEQEGEARHQCTSKEQVAPAFGIEGAESEANENHRGSHESRHDDARINSDDKVQCGAKANTCEEGKPCQDSQSLLLCLRVVWRHGKPKHHPQGAKHRQQPTLKEACDDMDVGASSSHKHTNCQAGVHILQVHLGRMRYLGELEEGVKVDVAVKHVHDVTRDQDLNRFLNGRGLL